MFKKISITRYFTLFAVLITIFAVAIYFYLSQRIFKSDILSGLRSQNMYVEKSLTDGIEYSSYLMEYLGKQIKKHNPRDLAYINQLLSFFNDDIGESRDTVWNTFFWSDDTYSIVVNSEEGIIDPVSIEDRDYLIKTVEEPEKIHLGKLVFGRVSKEWAIPTSMGILDNDGKYVGSFIFGFKFAELKAKIDKFALDANINYAVFNYESKLMISSDNFSHDDQLLSLIGQAIASSSTNGELEEFSLFGDKSTYGFFHKNERHSYIVVTQYNDMFLDKKFHDMLSARFLEASILIVIFCLIFYLLKMEVFRPISRLSEISRLITTNRGDECEVPETMIVEIDDLARQLELIKEYRVNLSIARKSQERFFANMSHELRTPLNGILNLSEMMKKELFGKMPDEYKNMSKDINHSGKYLLSLLDDILSFSQMNRNDAKIKEEEFYIQEEIEEVIKLTAVKPSVSVNYEIAKKVAKVKADRKLIKQLLLDLLSNAVKYTDHGSVIIRVFYEHGLAIEVVDTGIGISEEELNNLSGNFGQIGDGYSREVKQGKGLGLFLVKKIVDLHQGRFEIRSVHGQGTVVRIIFSENRIMT